MATINPQRQHCCAMWLAAVVILCQLHPLTATVSSIIRDNPRLPGPVGLRNWESLQGSKFTPRHSHATAQFSCPSKTETCLWLTGGYSESHWSGENANADVWWSLDGAEWNQVVELGGDWLQGIGNHDAERGGSRTPFYGRFGHSLSALDADGDGVTDAMILLGGYSPLPSNDVWISADGKDWFFGGFAPWPERAHHGAAVFNGKLYIMGGTPLSNDVWIGTLHRDATQRAGFRMDWKQEDSAQWSPRAGHCVVAKNSAVSVPNATDADVSFSEKLFLIGGISEGAGGTMTRSDIWTSLDGNSWEQVVVQLQGNDDDVFQLGGRAFHGCAAFTVPSEGTTPRLYVTGGGYYGNNMNRVVSALEAYTGWLPSPCWHCSMPLTHTTNTLLMTGKIPGTVTTGWSGHGSTMKRELSVKTIYSRQMNGLKHYGTGEQCTGANGVIRWKSSNAQTREIVTTMGRSVKRSQRCS